MPRGTSPTRGIRSNRPDHGPVFLFSVIFHLFQTVRSGGGGCFQPFTYCYGIGFGVVFAWEDPLDIHDSRFADSDMSTTLDRPRSETRDAPPLAPLLSRRWALDRTQFACVAIVSLFFLYASHVPVFHAEVWGHVAFGHWILEHQALPQSDPFVPLTDGMRLIDGEWLSQVAMAEADRLLGPEAVSFLFAGISLVAFGLFFWLCVRIEKQPLIAVFSGIATWCLLGSQHAIVRPELFGLVCFFVLWHLLQSFEEHNERPISFGRLAGCGGLFVLWANLDSSFALGMLILAVFLLVQTVKLFRETRGFGGTICSPRVIGSLLMFEAACLGSLLNPYGIDLWLDVVASPVNNSLASLAGHHPLLMTSPVGIAVGIAVLGTLGLMRVSRAKIDPSVTAVWVLLGIGVCLQQRMLMWFIPVTVLLWQPLLAERLRSVLPDRTPRSDEEPGPVRASEFRLSLVGLLVVWLAFTFSPSSRLLLGGAARTPERYLDRGTPLALSGYLHEHPVRGQMVHPAEWGDWLARVCPGGTELMMTTPGANCLPQTVWKDYRGMEQGEEGLETRLEKYRVTAVIVDPATEETLETKLRSLAGWTLAYEDDQALLFERTSLVGSAVKTPELASRD